MPAKVRGSLDCHSCKAMIRSETEDTTRDPVGVKGIMMEYYEQLYTHRLDNLDEMDQVLGKQNYCNSPQIKQIHLITL